MRVLLALTLAAATGVSALALEETRSIQTGVYTEEQAEKGREVFAETCEACHHPAEFSEGGYMESWSGQSVGDFIDLVRSTMPQDSPGRLQHSDYIDVTAYLFALNGVPTGDSKMERENVKGLRIEGPFESKQ